MLVLDHYLTNGKCVPPSMCFFHSLSGCLRIVQSLVVLEQELLCGTAGQYLLGESLLSQHLNIKLSVCGCIRDTWSCKGWCKATILLSCLGKRATDCSFWHLILI